MSDKPTDRRDWTSASEALFRSARSDHAPSDADRERVRSGLARRIAGANVPKPSQPPAELADKAGAAVSSLFKLGLALAVVIAGLAVFMRSGGDSTPPHASQAASTPDPSTEQPPPEPAPTAATEPTASNEVPARAVAQRSKSAAQAERAPRRARERTRVAPRPAPQPDTQSEETRAIDTSDPASSQSVVVSSSRVARQTAPSASGVSASTAVRNAAGSTTSTRAAAEQPAPVARPSPTQVAQDDKGDEERPDARAELAFVRRIQVALLQSEPHTVLALCAEHERRWPHGTFVQEREGLRAIASCQSGLGEAAERARGFFARYPHGPLAPRVHKACAAQLSVTAGDARR